MVYINQLMGRVATLCVVLGDDHPLLLFSNRYEIRSVDLETMVSKSLINSLKNTIALDFLHREGGEDLIFWTDVVEDKIYKGILTKGCK